MIPTCLVALDTPLGPFPATSITAPPNMILSGTCSYADDVCVSYTELREPDVPVVFDEYGEVKYAATVISYFNGKWNRTSFGLSYWEVMHIPGPELAWCGGEFY